MANQMLKVPCTLFWANPNRADKYGKVSATLGRLSKETVDELKAVGLGNRLKFDAERDPSDSEFQGFHLKVRNDEAVRCVGAEGALPATLLLGNGTEAVAVVQAKDWVNPEAGTSGTKAIWRGVKILNLVKYDPDAKAVEKADAMLDEISGGVEFGEGTADSPAVTSEDDDEINAIFAETE